MKRRIGEKIVIFLFLLPCSALAGPTFQDGIAAFDKKDFDRAMAIWKPLANQGNAEAQFGMGLLFTDNEPATAVKWFRLSAEQGYAPAQSRMGGAYRTGRGVPLDRAEAIRWYNAAAAQGHPGAKKMLKEMAGSAGPAAQSGHGTVNCTDMTSHLRIKQWWKGPEVGCNAVPMFSLTNDASENLYCVFRLTILGFPKPIGARAGWVDIKPRETRTYDDQAGYDVKCDGRPKKAKLQHSCVTMRDYKAYEQCKMTVGNALGDPDRTGR